MSSNQDTKAIIIQPEGRGRTPLQEWPVHTECPYCGGFILTSLEYETGTLTWIMCFFIMFIGLFLGCCLVPFCMDGCKDIAHICPDCKKEVGRFYRI
ncbi:lipopolysaccharide-induced tumor necrosis factor-alpha factor homolog [Crassostrea angulata]|uniref:lipopolysaccharide-induced tumor necrosis factor-alpha factor homolog n=1 Tax=Magallana angulata TaxID=2784310 RepID=UPI0022B21786|nr:lipopolysaccharide-induced tumor necrosis factor-alpha factor homolog [Crassostrea angulata]